MGIVDANWVMALPRVMTAANSGRNKGANEIAPYDAVFGMSYDHEIISANAINFVENENLQERAKRIGGAYRDKMEDLDELENTRIQHLSTPISLTRYKFNPIAKSLITKRKATFYTQSQTVQNGDIYCMPCENQEDINLHCESDDSSLLSAYGMPIIQPKSGEQVKTQIKSSPAEEMLYKTGENEDHTIADFDSEFQTLSKSNEITNDQPFDGKCVMLLIEGSGEPFHPRLFCKKCDPKDGYLLTTVFPKPWLQINYVEDKNSWFSWQFVMLYSLLLKHLYEDQLTKLAIVLMDPDYKECTFRGMSLKPTVEQCASIGFCLSESHFAVILCEIKDSHIYIIDGLYSDPLIWKDHAFKLLQEINHPLKMSDMKILHAGLRNFTTIQRDPNILTISHKSYIQQQDGCNCGPIACTVLHSLLLKSIENYGSLIDDRKNKYISNKAYVESLRESVVRHYSTLVHGVKEDLTLQTELSPTTTEMTTENTVIIDSTTEKIVLSEKKGLNENLCDNQKSNLRFDMRRNNTASIDLATDKKGETVENKINEKLELNHHNGKRFLLNTIDKNRKLKRMRTNDTMIKRQKKFADKNQASYYKNTASKNVKLGDYVRIKVDRRDRYLNNYTSLGGIVFCVIPAIFSIQVVTNDGILSTSTGNSKRSIPVSEYEIVTEGVVETTEFKHLRELVLSAKLNENNLPTLGMKEMHKQQVRQHVTEQDVEGRLRLSKKRQTSKEISRGHCRCKDGTCTFRCGCNKKNLPCTTRCACRGNCPRSNLGKAN